jgi:uncharacterized membrane protein YedE/YeeE
MKKRILIFLAGMLFGAGLALSGMTDPERVIGFLDIGGDWDPTLAFVMGGALLTFAVGSFLVRKKANLQCASCEPVSRNLVIGSVIFGIGWGLGGFCPGPAIANLAELRTEALVFVPMMALSMFLVQRTFGVDR